MRCRSSSPENRTPATPSAVRATLPLLQKGRGALEAAIAGAQVVEEGTNSHSVGYGGLANRIGTVSLDACVMDGRTLGCAVVGT